jgi:hypothetical protein
LALADMLCYTKGGTLCVFAYPDSKLIRDR